MAQVSDPTVHEQLEQFMIKMGIFWQIQDDYLDAFADPAVTGKIGTDIQDGKCCWPVVTALKLASNRQRDVLQQHFGVKNEESVLKVRQVYEQLNIEAMYREHEQRLFEELQRLSDQLCESYKLPSDMFHFLLTKLHRRNK
jgi:farnesyl diphosphate synthase